MTTYQGPAGDHNDRAMTAVRQVGAALGEVVGTEAVLVGEPTTPVPGDWRAQLDAADAQLRRMADRVHGVMAAGLRPVSAITRCAVALATQPVVLRHRPDAVIVWLDAHADINVPEDTGTGYLGGMAFSAPLGWWDSGLGAGLPAQQAVLVGSRDIDPPERARIDAGAPVLVGCGAGVGDRLAEAVGDRPVYVHLDCDVLQPGLVATDYHVPDGLSLDDLRECARALAGHDVVGVEIAEFEGPATLTAADLVAALRPILVP